ncbi:hypothetical protein FIBSPDRAFT_949271 [Athelia psychrophila]|uniref:Uncharacterized protein n=1 Tax=Athelia psychrophila TaxID=1759441 RepID=A0A166Q2P1_9AGAM|nr:hypothetical protein FIBSPDRAFT_949271 [Fibularhizoctonia sp. CBS 109695]
MLELEEMSDSGSEDIPGLEDVSDSSDSEDDAMIHHDGQPSRPRTTAAVSFYPPSRTDVLLYVDDFVPTLAAMAAWWNRFHIELTPESLDNVSPGGYRTRWDDNNPWGRLCMNTENVELPDSDLDDVSSDGGYPMPPLEDIPPADDRATTIIHVGTWHRPRETQPP